jgi:hypothetical protein
MVMHPDNTTITPVITGAGAMTTMARPGYAWMCIDIETANGRPEELERWMRQEWAPSPSWKAATIGERYLKLYESKLEKLALLDESPIISIGIRSDTELRVLHCLEQHSAMEREAGDTKGLVEGFAGMPDMLVAFRNLMELSTDEETVLIGHNVKHFDFPKLRWAYIRHGIRPPAVLLDPGQPVFDTMKEFSRYSINRGDVMIGVADLLELLGIEHHKGIVSGADIPKMFEERRFGEIIDYQLLDVILEAEAYLRMTGQMEGLL